MTIPPNAAMLKLEDPMREAIKAKQSSRHPAEMGAEEITAFSKHV